MKKSKIVQDIKNRSTDSQNKYLRKFRMYPAFLYAYLDKWLQKMSLKGWHVVHSNIFFFWFEEGNKELREYFTYGLSTQEGKYSLEHRYPFLEKTYGVSKKKSKINSNDDRVYRTVEISPDALNDIGYKELVQDRDRLYTRYFIRNISIFSAVILLWIIVKLFFFG